MRICHDSQKSQYRVPFGAVTCGQSVTLRLYAEGAQSVSIRLWQEGKGETMLPMTQSDAMFSAALTVPHEPCVLWYFFVVNDGEKTICYGNNPESLGGEGCICEDGQPPSFQITVYRPFQTPDWYKEALVYQIFPDRFARGKDFEERKAAAQLPEGWKGPTRSFVDDWYELPHYEKDAQGNITDWQFYGGTLQGIREKIPYLRSLGVTALYLNPIFKAASNHRYDTADYRQIDPLLGTNADFMDLADACAENGIRIILDGVFSHTGADSIYFDKYENYQSGGAFHHPDSKYRSWYRFREEAPGYECWWGVTDLPNTEETAPSYDIFICGPNGVLEYWTQLGASGFRLDVADELPDSFIKNIHDTLKAQNEDNLLIGEVWEDASNKYSYGQPRSYFSGDELDGVMNYPFRDHAAAYLTGQESASMFCRRIKSLAENYPEEAFYSSLNIIDGHDCVRALSMFGGDSAAARMKMLSALQYVMPGVPCIYYGDEAGLQGGTDPDNRRPFPWGREDGSLQFHYRMLGVIYQEHPALKNGDFSIRDHGECLVLGRSDAKERILLILNPTAQTQMVTERVAGYTYALELLESQELVITDDFLDVAVAPLTAMMVLLQPAPPARVPLEKAAGVLCHLSSMPGEDPYKGALGKRGRAFVDWLASCGFSLWQILPLNPVGPGNTPYFSPCVFAGDTRYIDEEEIPDDSGYDEFCKENAYWLADWAAYCVQEKMAEGTTAQGSNAKIAAANTASGNQSDLIDRVLKDQYIFFTQWKALRAYANSKGISIIGDLPIYTSPGSCDVKAHPEAFQVDENGRPIFVGGVPPDYFSADGQYWSNPLYNWDHMKKDRYEWWYQRFKMALELYDYIRLDHFRSFSEYYAIPEGASAKEGLWQIGPGLDFFRTMEKRLGRLPIIAEDLGLLDSGVYNLLKLCGFPGMNIWQFHEKEMQAMTSEEASRRIFYTGTHDNQTLVSWYAQAHAEENNPYTPGSGKAVDSSVLKTMDVNSANTSADEFEKHKRNLLEIKAKEIIEELIASDAPWVIFPLQDLLFLDDSARMNVPGTIEGNWIWQCKDPLPEWDVNVR